MKIKRRSKYLLVVGAIIGALAIIAGSTAAVAVHSNNKLVAKSAITNSTKSLGTENSHSTISKTTSNDKDSTNANNPSSSTSDSNKATNSSTPAKNASSSPSGPSKITKTPDGTTNDSHSVISLLDTLLSNIINVAKYDEMSSNTVQEAFNVQSTLKQAIKQAIQNEIATAANKFLAINSTYSIQDIIDNIQITLPISLSALDIEQAQISNVTLSYENTPLSNSSNTSNFIVQGFKETISSSDIQSINQQIAQMIETNVNNIITHNTDGYYVVDYLFNEGYYSGKFYKYKIPNAILLSGFNTITAGQALNIQSYKTQWINALETQIIGASTKTFTFNDLTFTAQEISANLTVNVDQWQFINNHGEIEGVSLSYAGNALTFSFPTPIKAIQELTYGWKSNEINIFGFAGFSSWQGAMNKLNGLDPSDNITGQTLDIRINTNYINNKKQLFTVLNKKYIY